MEHSSASNAARGRTIRRLLAYYFAVIRPFALTISQAWIWVNDLSFVLSSPALTYAICAYSSAFQVSAEDDLHKLVLPPNDADNQSLWPIPEWFTFQAQSISLLRRHLAYTTTESQRPIQKAELHAMLFIMRLYILIGDRQSTLLHLDAINSATKDATIMPDLHIDMAMWKLNLPVTYKHRSQIRTRPYIRAKDPSHQSPIQDIDTSTMTDEDERSRARAYVLNRKIIWRPNIPQEIDPDDGPYGLVYDFLQNEPKLQTFGDVTKQEVTICLQISRYLSAYLRYVNADTSQERIRQLLLDLQHRLLRLNQDSRSANLRRALPQPLLYVAFVGIFASRGFEDDLQWFMQHLRETIASASSIHVNDIFDVVSRFLDLDTIHPVLLKEICDNTQTHTSANLP